MRQAHTKYACDKTFEIGIIEARAHYCLFLIGWWVGRKIGSNLKVICWEHTSYHTQIVSEYDGPQTLEQTFIGISRERLLVWHTGKQATQPSVHFWCKKHRSFRSEGDGEQRRRTKKSNKRLVMNMTMSAARGGPMVNDCDGAEFRNVSRSCDRMHLRQTWVFWTRYIARPIIMIWFDINWVEYNQFYTIWAIMNRTMST